MEPKVWRKVNVFELKKTGIEASDKVIDAVQKDELMLKDIAADSNGLMNLGREILLRQAKRKNWRHFLSAPVHDQTSLPR